MDNSFKNVIDSAKTVLIMLPLKPTFDQVASSLGLYLALRDKKDVQIYSPSPMTVEFNRLIGVNKITQDLGNKNLIIRFVDYKANDIERVSYDIEDGQFRLTVIPKQKINPPQKEQINLAYSGISADTVIMVGGGNESHFPALAAKELVNSNIVHIGVKDISLSSNKSYISFAKPASSVSEITTSLIKTGGVGLDEDSSTNLLMGIEQMTNGFTDPTVSAETFMLVSELMRNGGRRISSQAPAMPGNYPPGAIPTSPRPFPQMPYQPLGQTQTITQGTQSSVQQAPYQRPIQQPQQVTGQQQKTKMPPPPLVEEVKPETQQEEEEPPKDWLQPKIFKGTSVS